MIRPVGWEEREAWFAGTLAMSGSAPAPMGEHAGALLAELEPVFCAGAWLAAIVLASAVIEAQLRATVLPGALWQPVDVLLAEAGLPDAYDDLRRERNSILHPRDPPQLSVETLWFEDARLEQMARTAVRLVAALIAGRGAEEVTWP